MSSPLRATQQTFDFEAAGATDGPTAPTPTVPAQQPSAVDRLATQVERIASTQQFLAAAVVEIRKNLPVQRRALSERTRNLHIQVVATRRNGLCPCCQEMPVCTAEGKLPGAEFDHWYGRSRNRATETWLVCAECNGRLETSTEFKDAARSAFESYQRALAPFLAGRQGTLHRAFGSRRIA